ncbi:hypothetical protein ACFQBQ_14160 [Granulicella cerasi]|uniref:Outer membrane protein beta-barrel domain-containing protein n=1 Tax=Granulicella cerasi TaxID=741063 RepID=A0ABW1ZB57_9BACT
MPATQVPARPQGTLAPMDSIPEPATRTDDVAQAPAGSENVVPLGTEIYPKTAVPAPSNETLAPLQHTPTGVYESAPPPTAGNDHIPGLGNEIYPAPKTAAAADQPAPGTPVYAQPGQPSTYQYTVPAKPKDAAPAASPLPPTQYAQPGQPDPQTGMPIGVLPPGVSYAPQPQSVGVGEPPLQGRVLGEQPPQRGDDLPPAPIVHREGVRPFSALAVQMKAGSQGTGLEFATPLAKRFNLRVGGTYFSYASDFNVDGMQINGAFFLRSGTVGVDIMPFNNWFRITPGMTIYSGNSLHATTYVPGGGKFSLGDDDYTSDPTNPVHGVAHMNFARNYGPSLTFGTSNMIPRSGRHWSIPVDIGFEYLSQPKLTMVLAGSACGSQNGSYGCSDIATDPDAQTSLAQQVQNINNDISPLRFYPVITVGFSWAFHSSRWER